MVHEFQLRLGRFLARNTLTITRVALGVVFLWFGLLKFCPGLCDVEVMAQQTMTLLTFHLIPPATCVHVLAVWECAMGLTLLFAPSQTRIGAIALRLCVLSLFAHLAGTFLPLVLFPHEVWKHVPYAPTLAGQYILKNLVLLASAASVGTATYPTRSTLRLVPAVVRARRTA